MYNEISVAAKWWKEHFVKSFSNQDGVEQSSSTSNKNSNSNALTTPSKSNSNSWRSTLTSSPSTPNPKSASSSSTTSTTDLSSTFESEVIKELTKRYQGHWYEEDPLRGSAYRSLTYDHRLDSLFIKIAYHLGIGQQKMEQALSSARFSVMFVNPGHVKVANLVLINSPPISLYVGEVKISNRNNNSHFIELPKSSAAAWSPFSAAGSKSMSFLPSKELEEKTNDEMKPSIDNSHATVNNPSDLKNFTSNSNNNNSRWANAVGANGAYLSTFSPTAPLSPASPSNLSINLNSHQNLDGMSQDVLAMS